MKSLLPRFTASYRGNKSTTQDLYDLELTSFDAYDTVDGRNDVQAMYPPHPPTTYLWRVCISRIRRSTLSVCTLRTLPRAGLMLLGWYQLVLVVLSLIDALCPDSAFSVLASVALDGSLGGDTLSVPDATPPIFCHSHNDYWRVRPFHSAIELGCISVEADVWLNDNDLVVGHNKPSTSSARNLRSMYLEPMQEILDRRNQGLEGTIKFGIYESQPTRSLVLLVDFKADGEAIWPVLHQQLQPLRDRNYLTFFNGTDVIEGPVTIVASGDVSFRDVIHDFRRRDVFFDAPLELMENRKPASLKFDLKPDDVPVDMAIDQALPLRRPVNPAVYSPANSYYASVSFTQSIGYPWGSRLSRAQVDLIRNQIRGAHERGLKARYWDVPTWPLGVRNYLWRVLVREGVDCLSVDDIKAAARGDWGPRKGGWHRKWWT